MRKNDDGSYVWNRNTWNAKSWQLVRLTEDEAAIALLAGQTCKPGCGHHNSRECLFDFSDGYYVGYTENSLERGLRKGKYQGRAYILKGVWRHENKSDVY